MEKIEENKVEEQKKHNKWKVNWFDWIAFINIGLFFVMFTFLPQIEKTEKFLTDDQFFIVGFSFMMTTVISIIIFMTFCGKNIKILKRCPVVIFVNKKPLIAQIYGILFLLTYLLVANLLFESIF